MESSFFSPGKVTRDRQTASLHLSRDHLLPVQLSTVASRAEDEGYAEGVVTNTKFGSFPHSTLIGIPWGSQVLASKVDTGTRGRVENVNQNKKRKASAISTDVSPLDRQSPAVKQATAAGSGFIHVLPPTPESWTTSLPHRTQVVYTPDYSYVLQRIRARPGSTLIEAGSGSGSFTHAAARAVFQGDDLTSKIPDQTPSPSSSAGKVFTFEFHAERHEKIRTEMKEHKLDPIVTAAHRDVYRDGFWIHTEDGRYLSPQANAIFLDLPAPWEALPHLSRENINGKPSVLDAQSAVHLCTFSPCIEQVQRTISVMRKLGWLEIEMVEIQHKRIDVRRDYTGFEFDGMRGVNPVAATVDEALTKLRDMENRSRDFQDRNPVQSSKRKENIQANKQQDAAKLHWDQGRLIHRSEPELKTHTSYLVFAILPRKWTEEDEKLASIQAQQPQQTPAHIPKSQKQLKREAKHRKQMANGVKEKVEADMDESNR